MRFFWTSVLVLALMALIPGAVSAEQASDPLCGTTLTEDLVLEHNVVCYNSSGLTIGAENLTIDLNGKTIECHDGPSSDCRGGKTVGIDASAVNRVQIKGPGAVNGFGTQVLAATDAQRANATASSRTPRPVIFVRTADGRLLRVVQAKPSAAASGSDHSKSSGK